MFEKLISSLPTNPSLLHQLSFYGKRMRGEQSVRRLGLLFIVLAFLVQFFAVLSPPQSTVAASNNDLVNGGINSAAYAANICRANTGNYGGILANYGISCDAVAGSPTVTLNSNDYNRSLYSMGRLPYGLQGETPVNISGSTYYLRYLWAWDTGASSTYTALKVVSSTGATYFLLYNCGNLVSIGLPQPPPPPPPPPPAICKYDHSIPATSNKCVVCQYNNTITESNANCKPCTASLSSADTLACVVIHKSATNLTQSVADANNTTAQPNDKIEYTLYAQNKGKATVKGYVFTEDLSDVLDYATVDNLNGGTINQNGQVTWPKLNIKAGDTVTEKLTVIVKSVIPQTPASSSDPGHFNLIMTNVYGNTINIHVPGSPAKTIETAAAVLPNTGPGTTLFLGAVIVILAGYFFSRARLLADETTIAVHDNISGGL